MLAHCLKVVFTCWREVNIIITKVTNTHDFEVSSFVQSWSCNCIQVPNDPCICLYSSPVIGCASGRLGCGRQSMSCVWPLRFQESSSARFLHQVPIPVNLCDATLGAALLKSRTATSMISEWWPQTKYDIRWELRNRDKQQINNIYYTSVNIFIRTKLIDIYCMWYLPIKQGMYLYTSNIYKVRKVPAQMRLTNDRVGQQNQERFPPV